MRIGFLQFWQEGVDRIMGRKRTKHLNLPPGMRVKVQASGKRYYYYDKGNQPDGSRPLLSLGSDFLEALRQYADLEVTIARPPVTIGEAIRRFQTEMIAGRPINTQKDIVWSIPNLLKFFDQPPAPFSKVKPIAVRQYLDWRSAAPVRANREIAWFSTIWNWARNKGMTDAPNPCAGIRRHREKARTMYIEDAELELLHSHASEPLREAMELAYLLSLRPSDVLDVRETDIRNGELAITPSKTRNSTGKQLRFSIDEGGALDLLLKRIQARKSQFSVRPLHLLVDESGLRLTKAMLRGRFVKARQEAANAAGNTDIAARLLSIQFRDLRAKAGTDKAESSGDVRQAQEQLGHSSILMTETYIRARKGKKLKPTK